MEECKECGEYLYETAIVFHEQGREYMMLCEICPRCGLIDKIISITGEEYVRKS